MKTLLSAAALVLALLFGSMERSSPNTYYYFCFSRPVASTQSNGRQLILYTPVKKIVCEQDAFAAMAKSWGDQVLQLRKGRPPGTSDLNFYTTPDSATTLLGVAERYYSDSSKYLLVNTEPSQNR